MSGGDSLHAMGVRDTSSQFKNFSSDVFENSSTADGTGSSDSVVGGNTVLQESVNSSNRELR